MKYFQGFIVSLVFLSLFLAHQHVAIAQSIPPITPVECQQCDPLDEDHPVTAVAIDMTVIIQAEEGESIGQVIVINTGNDGWGRYNYAYNYTTETYIISYVNGFGGNCHYLLLICPDLPDDPIGPE